MVKDIPVFESNWYIYSTTARFWRDYSILNHIYFSITFL